MWVYRGGVFGNLHGLHLTDVDMSTGQCLYMKCTTILQDAIYGVSDGSMTQWEYTGKRIIHSSMHHHPSAGYHFRVPIQLVSSCLSLLHSNRFI